MAKLLCALLRTHSEEEENGSCERIENGGSDVMWTREFHDRANQKGYGCRKVEIFGLHGR